MPTKKTTRRAKGDGLIHKRSDGRWEARYTIGKDPGTGKQVRRSVYGKTQDEVRRKLKAATQAVDEGTYTEPSKLSLSAWLDIWVSEYLEGVKPRTADSYKSTCNNHLKPKLGAMKLDNLQSHTIQEFYNRLYRGDGDAPLLSAKTLKNIHGVLHRALSQAVNIGYLRQNPADACNLPKVQKKEIRPLEEAEITTFLEAVQGHRYAIVYMVTLFTGMRQGEVLGLTWDNIDLDGGVITINKQLQRERGGAGEYHFVAPKNGKGRQITPPATALKLLRAQRAKQNEWRLQAGQAWANDTNLVFTDELGHNLSPQTVYLHFKKVAGAIGLPEARFHDLRHTYAVAALQSGIDVKTVQENLGHHTAAFTLDIYGHVTRKMAQDAADKMENFIKGVSNL